MTHYLRTCADTDRSTLHALRDRSEQWLTEKGLDQYQGKWSEKAHRQIDSLLDERRFLALCSVADSAIHCVAALVGPDRDFWTEGDDLHSAWYVSRLMVAGSGQGAGSRMLDALALAAGFNGRRFLRLDCWRTNERLHDYYRGQGFNLVRVEEREHRMSGALFQRRVSLALPAPWDQVGPQWEGPSWPTDSD